ncbi:MAG TPA: CpsD/CapB family tyrosine-protein kinase [Bryobacteraceae bacterium]|nr:CpsD/CapB family tyrosine-protein kinase [Bryobacteraceae bacterium]
MAEPATVTFPFPEEFAFGEASVVTPLRPPEPVHLEEAKTGIGLEGCKVAAIGFGRRDIGSLAACMIEQRARIEFFPRGGYNGGEYDLLILNSGSVETFKKEISSFAAALQSGIPSIITGSRSVFTTAREIGGAQAWDFVPKPFHMDELTWRAANLLGRPREGGNARRLPEPTVSAEQDQFARTPVESANKLYAVSQALNLSSVAECQPPTGDGTFGLLEPSCPSEHVEQFRLLRTQLMLHRGRFDEEQHFRVVCVMSTHKGEGKSFTASNLAAVLAVAGAERVLLIDSDPESPPLKIGLTLPEEAGLASALSEPADWARAVRRVKGTRLYVMARGGSIPSPNLDFSPLPELLQALRPQFEWIILDGAAFASCPDAQWLTTATDGTLLVVRENASSFGAVQESLASVPPERLVGVVFNHWQS